MCWSAAKPRSRCADWPATVPRRPTDGYWYWWRRPNPDNWLIGDEIMKGHNCLRDMIAPENGWSPQPSVYKGQYWVNTNDKNNDNGGVHTNSGVQNHWFYLLCEDSDYTDPTGTVSHFDGVGIDRGVQIAYRSLSGVRMNQTTTEGLPSGIYIQNGCKLVVK